MWDVGRVSRESLYEIYLRLNLSERIHMFWGLQLQPQSHSLSMFSLLPHLLGCNNNLVQIWERKSAPRGSRAIKWPSERIGTRAVQKVTQPGSWRFHPPPLQRADNGEQFERKKRMRGATSEHSALVIKDSMRHFSCFFSPPFVLLLKNMSRGGGFGGV